MGLFLLLFLTVVFILLVGFRKKSAPQPDKAKTESLLLKHKEFFDRLFPNPLTKEQRLCIVDDSYRTLVIASAGSGKTTTPVGKYAFLFEEGLAATREILVLVFNKAIEQELSEKIKKLVAGGARPKVYTFHGFGLELLQRAEGRKRVDLLAESSSDGLLDTANDLFLGGLSVRLDSLRDRTRNGMFKRFFLPTFEIYEEILCENGTIDYSKLPSNLR